MFSTNSGKWNQRRHQHLQTWQSALYPNWPSAPYWSGSSHASARWNRPELQSQCICLDLTAVGVSQAVLASWSPLSAVAVGLTRSCCDFWLAWWVEQKASVPESFLFLESVYVCSLKWQFSCIIGRSYLDYNVLL